MDVFHSAGQLHELGLDHNDFRRLVAQSELHRVRRGYYSPAAAPDDERAHKLLVAATMHEIQDGTVISHSSAAVLHGLPVRRRELSNVYVTRPGSTHGQHRGVIRLSRARLSEEDVVVVGDVAVTSLARTVTDIARTLPFHWAIAAGDAALRLGMDDEDLAQAAVRGKGRRGNRKAMGCVPVVDGLSESPLESISRAQMVRFGVPQPTLQHEVRWRGQFIGRTDFAWLDYGVLGECDGRIKYGALLKPGETEKDVMARQNRREAALRRAGFIVVRWGWDEALDGGRMAARINEALARAIQGTAS